MKYLLKCIFPFLRFGVFQFCLALMSRLSAALSSATHHAMPPEFGRKCGTECLNTRFDRDFNLFNYVSQFLINTNYLIYMILYMCYRILIVDIMDVRDTHKYIINNHTCVIFIENGYCIPRPVSVNQTLR